MKKRTQLGRMAPGLVVGVAMVAIAALVWYLGYRMNYEDVPPAKPGAEGSTTSFVTRAEG